MHFTQCKGRRQWQCDRFLWAAAGLSLVRSSGVLVRALSGPRTTGMAVTHALSCGDFSEVYIKFSSSRGFGKRTVLLPCDSKSERGVGEKWEMFMWRVGTRYRRKLEEFRIQSNLQVGNKTLKTMSRTRTLRPPRVCASFLLKHYFSIVNPISIKEGETNLFA